MMEGGERNRGRTEEVGGDKNKGGKGPLRTADPRRAGEVKRYSRPPALH